MDRVQVGDTVRALALGHSRRSALGLALRSALATGGLTVLIDGADARKRRRKRKKRTNIKRNAFGCVNVGGPCQRSDQCCSGICAGKRGKQRCQAHDATTCQGDNFCLTEPVACTTTDGGAGECAVTTGNASYCMTDAYCIDCATDADCVPICGAGAACILCPQCGMAKTETACAGTFDNACFLPGP